jgi:hypothetical protein
MQFHHRSNIFVMLSPPLFSHFFTSLLQIKVITEEHWTLARGFGYRHHFGYYSGINSLALWYIYHHHWPSLPAIIVIWLSQTTTLVTITNRGHLSR